MHLPIKNVNEFPIHNKDVPNKEWTSTEMKQSLGLSLRLLLLIPL